MSCKQELHELIEITNRSIYGFSPRGGSHTYSETLLSYQVGRLANSGDGKNTQILKHSRQLDLHVHRQVSWDNSLRLLPYQYSVGFIATYAEVTSQISRLFGKTQQPGQAEMLTRIQDLPGFILDKSHTDPFYRNEQHGLGAHCFDHQNKALVAVSQFEKSYLLSSVLTDTLPAVVQAFNQLSPLGLTIRADTVRQIDSITRQRDTEVIPEKYKFEDVRVCTFQVEGWPKPFRN